MQEKIQEVTNEIAALLEKSGLDSSEQVEVLRRAKECVRPEADIENWRAGRIPLLKPGEKKSKQKREAE